VLYLADTDGQAIDPAADGPWLDAFALREGLTLIDSPDSRSAVYHGVKGLLPDGTALLVAPLSDDPKFKGMAEGAAAWLAERSRR
jgi:hypothetical protein